MRAFSRLFRDLDQTTRTTEKVEALVRYFREAPPEDAAWALFFLAGHQRRRFVGVRTLRQWAAEESGMPEWLVEESHEAVGDLAETLSRILPYEGAGSCLPLHVWVRDRLLSLEGATESFQKEVVVRSWKEADVEMRLVGNKLITGGFRVGVSRALIVRALASWTGLPGTLLNHRMMGVWMPTPEAFLQLTSPDGGTSSISQPYPFCLAHPLDSSPAELGAVGEWQVEWKWDGVRIQAIRRAGQTFLWSRGEELVTETFPEIASAVNALPDGTVIDGEIVAWDGGKDQPGSFQQLQRRLGRSIPSRAFQKSHPVVMLWFDVLERGGVDLRKTSLMERRSILKSIYDAWRTTVLTHTSDNSAVAGGGGEQMEWDFGSLPEAGKNTEATESRVMRLAEVLDAKDWDAVAGWRGRSREHHAEGLMLKRLDSDYVDGRFRGGWWKWKVDPFVVDAVLVGAQPGHGRRATLFTDYTFAVWNGDKLVPVAKAYSGLTEEEIKEVDGYVKSNIVGRFGPVRSVVPGLVFELGFEGIAESGRHKSGVALRFPRILRWRRDKVVDQADTLEGLRGLLKVQR